MQNKNAYLSLSITSLFVLVSCMPKCLNLCPNGLNLHLIKCLLSSLITSDRKCSVSLRAAPLYLSVLQKPRIQDRIFDSHVVQCWKRNSFAWTFKVWENWCPIHPLLSTTPWPEKDRLIFYFHSHKWEEGNIFELEEVLQIGLFKFMP